MKQILFKKTKADRREYNKVRFSMEQQKYFKIIIKKKYLALGKSAVAIIGTNWKNILSACNKTNLTRNCFRKTQKENKIKTNKVKKLSKVRLTVFAATKICSTNKVLLVMEKSTRFCQTTAQVN